MGGVCRPVLVIVGLRYLATLILFVIGTFGLFGSAKGPLAGEFLAPLGLPGILILDGVPEIARPWLAASATSPNLILPVAACRLLSARRGT